LVLKDHSIDKLQDPRVDQELINKIDEAYLSYHEDFDVVEYQLQVYYSVLEYNDFIWLDCHMRLFATC
jgi:hypothetical protein